ncbi:MULTISPECIES: hypothetical protein [unclassified Bradyrhizobium]|uniref:hypothetical protein n=1 Tax=unclassified Bradyrhizobium TaxID=2631580 RepID=UPI0028E8F793|nr:MULTISPECIES: hypothetical protein [unclassified Bradyrhizobium]
MELLVKLESKNPSLNRDDMLEEYRDALLDPRNHDLLLSAIDLAFSLNFGKLHSKKIKKTDSEIAAQKARMAKVVESARDTVTKYVVEVGFWDYPMPNGKRLHECTVKEAKLLKPKIGGLLKIIDNLRGKPTDVIGEIYTKSQLKKLAT